MSAPLNIIRCPSPVTSNLRPGEEKPISLIQFFPCPIFSGRITPKIHINNETPMTQNLLPFLCHYRQARLPRESANRRPIHRAAKRSIIIHGNWKTKHGQRNLVGTRLSRPEQNTRLSSSTLPRGNEIQLRQRTGGHWRGHTRHFLPPQGCLLDVGIVCLGGGELLDTRTKPHTTLKEDVPGGGNKIGGVVKEGRFRRREFPTTYLGIVLVGKGSSRDPRLAKRLLIGGISHFFLTHEDPGL